MYSFLSEFFKSCQYEILHWNSHNLNRHRWNSRGKSDNKLGNDAFNTLIPHNTLLEMLITASIFGISHSLPTTSREVPEIIYTYNSSCIKANTISCISLALLCIQHSETKTFSSISSQFSSLRKEIYFLLSLGLKKLSQASALENGN